MKLNDTVKTPDDRTGQIAEFNYSYDGRGKLAKVRLSDIRGLTVSRWYITSELKPI